MSSIKTTQIDGDISVGRNVTMGGKAEIAGSVQINHNIKIKGWLDAPNVATPMKGLFSSEERLKAAYDDLREGWYALVHTGNGQAACWVVEGGKWKNTGDTVAITQGASIADFMDEVNTAIEAEAKDRYQGDAELNAKILQEVADRKTADDAESAARITADNNLSSRIDVEIADRVSDVEDLSNRIEAEKSARETADANLSGRIDDEVTARTTADDALDKDKEKRRKVYSFQLVDSLTTRSTHADIQKAFTTHFNDDSLIGVGGTGTSIKDVIAIPGAGDRLIDVWNKLTIYLDDQQQRAVITSVRQYETELSGVVGRNKKYDITYSDGIKSKTITLDAQNADLWKITNVVTFDAVTEIENLKKVLQDDISNEATTRANADNALSERIDTEATTRANADNDLSKRIGAEATARANVDANLSSRIDAEVTEREAAENELASRITDEMNVRSTAVQRLDNLLSEETQVRFTADDNLAGLIDDTKSYLNIRIDEEAQTRLTEDNKKKNKDFVMTMTYDNITTDEGAEFNLVDTEWDALADIVSNGECDIVLRDGIRNAYQLDHVFLSDGMPFGYKILPNNRTLNIATVIDSASGTLKLVWKFNDGAVTYDDLGGKPIVLQFKLDADGNRIPYEGIEPTAYIVEGATYEELKQAYQSKRPLYLFNNVGSQHSLSLANITAGLIPLTYQVDKLEEHTFGAYGTDGISGAEGEEFVFIGGYTIMGNIMENGEFVLVCYYGSNIATAKYDQLDRKPKINNNELIDNKTAEQLDLCRKPIVLRPKVDENGERIYLEEGFYQLEGATPTEIIQAMQLRRPLYLSFEVGLTSYSQIPSGLIPLTYRSFDDPTGSEFLYAYCSDGLIDGTSMGIGGYLIMGQYVDEQGEVTTNRTKGYRFGCAEMFKTICDHYDELSEKPKINGVELSGNKTSQDLKLQGALRTSADLALSDDVLSLTDMAKKRLFIDLWNECAVDFGRYNEDTGYFELNGITDLTWEDALMIYEISANTMYPNYANTDYWRHICGQKGKFRTNLPSLNLGAYGVVGCKVSTYLCEYIEVLNVFNRQPFNRPPFAKAQPFINSYTGVDLYLNRRLRKVMGYINITLNADLLIGYDLPMLEEIFIKGVPRSYKYFYKAPKLNYASVKYMVENRGGTNAITIWYHTDVYNKILGTADDAAYASSGGTKEEWMALADLATSKNITLATA